jgi:hypothetical protein
LAKSKVKYDALVGITRAFIVRMQGLAISDPIKVQLTALFQEIKDQDALVTAAYASAIDLATSDAVKQTNLRNIVVRLEIAVEKQKEIQSIIDAIPIAAIIPI